MAVAPTAPRLPADHKWWHQIELPDGSVTPGKDRSAEKLAGLHLPDLTGKTVLDVGAYDGYFSFAAERLGAARVVALDSYVWRQPLGKAGFEYVRDVLGSLVEDVEMDVLDISPERVGEFDVVLFLGVLYHMRHPLLALERVAAVTKQQLVVETLIDMTFLRSPSVAFYPWDMEGDATNWWGPNRAAVLGMLEMVGFRKAVPYPVTRFSAARLRSMPKRALSGVGPVTGGDATRTRSRSRVFRDIARSVLVQSRFVAHGLR
jgi:tRNA (mo5U34)-methyltransferase